MANRDTFRVARIPLDRRSDRWIIGRRAITGVGMLSVIAWLSLGGAVGVNARMHIQNGAPHILMLTY